MTQPAQMALGIAAIVILCALFMIFVIGPRVTPYSKTQWALLLTTLILLQTPITGYIIFVVAPSPGSDPRHVAGVGFLNLAVCIPLLILIGRKILRVK